MNDLELIEKYLAGELSAEERTQFEETIRTDPAVADALAFYVISKQAAKNEARAQRLAEFEALRKQLSESSFEDEGETPVWPLWGNTSARWLAAAASLVLLLGVGWYFFLSGDKSTRSGIDTQVASRLVDDYVNSNYRTLSTTLGGSADSLKQGTELYNNGDLAKAGVIFEDVLKREPDNDSALKFAGIVSLRQGNYDEAIDQFHRLSQLDLVKNPGLFLEALAHLKRGQPMDKSQAEKLLEEVINKNLDGKEEAKEILK